MKTEIEREREQERERERERERKRERDLERGGEEDRGNCWVYFGREKETEKRSPKGNKKDNFLCLGFPFLHFFIFF